MRPTRFNSGATLPNTLLDGLVQGVLLFGALFAAEWLALAGDLRSTLGTPLPTIICIYSVTGGGLGVVGGLVAWFIARRVPARPGRVSFMLLIYTCVVVFVLRSVPVQQLATVPPRLVGLLVAGVAAVAVGVWWARSASDIRALPRMRSLRFIGVVVAAVICAMCAAWVPLLHYRLPVREAAAADAPNVVFVLVDALRADRLSCAGYPRPTSPFIDRLAASGTMFENAYSHGNRTIIAMPSVFTSQYPSYARAIESGDWSTPLPDSQTTLAELFREAGYTTMGLMSNPYLKRPFGLTQGFDRTEEFNNGRFHLSLYRALLATGLLPKPRFAGGISANAAEVTDAAVAWLGRAPARSPFFCYVHYMDVHHPYLPPRVFEDMFNSRDWLSSIDPAGLFTKTVELVGKRQPYPLDDDELTRLSDLYDACIRYVDSEIARVVNVAQGVNDRPTIVVVTSDHGDEFQEHGFLYHNNIVIEELIRVPLVIWRSDRREAGRRVPELVRHVDLLPTLAEMAGFEAPAGVVGRSLSLLMDGGDDNLRASVAEGDHCSALIEPGWKLMRVDTTGTDTLFDLVADSRAKSDVGPIHVDRLEEMRRRLDAYVLGAPVSGTAARARVDAATLRQLQALGYVN